MVMAGLAVVVGIGLLVVLALAAARNQSRRAHAAPGGADGAETTWFAGMGGDSGPADCNGAEGGADGGACGGDGGGGGGGD